jgi:hypothetical protein
VEATSLRRIFEGEMTEPLPDVNQLPPHATVRWKYRSTSSSEHATHYDGPYKISVTDQDGDRTIWSVSLQGVEISSGTVEERDTKRCAFDIAMDTALASMRAMQAEPHDHDH